MDKTEKKENGYSILVSDEIDEITIIKGKAEAGEEDMYLKAYPDEKIPCGRKAALVSARWSGITAELYNSEELARIQMKEEMREDLARYHNDIDCFCESDYTANIYFCSDAGLAWRIVKEEDFKSEAISVLITCLPTGFKTSRFGSREGAKGELLKQLKKKKGVIRSLSQTCAAAEIDMALYLAGCGADFFVKDKLLVYRIPRVLNSADDIKFECLDEDANAADWLQSRKLDDVPYSVYTREEILGDGLIPIDDLL